MIKFLCLAGLVFAAVFVAGCDNSAPKSSENYTVPDPKSHPQPTNAAQQRHGGRDQGG